MEGGVVVAEVVAMAMDEMEMAMVMVQGELGLMMMRRLEQWKRQWQGWKK